MGARVQVKRVVQNPLKDVQLSSGKTQVVAQALDPYVHPEEKPSEYANIAKNALGIMGSYIGLQKVQKSDNIEKAKADFVQGKEADRPSSVLNLGGGYDEAYYGLAGEAKAIDFDTQYKLALQDNNFFEKSENPQSDAENLYRELYHKTFGDNPNQFMLEGATERLYTTKLEADKLMTNHFNERAKEETLTNTYKIISKGLHDIMENPNIELDKSPEVLSKFLSGAISDSLVSNPLLTPEDVTQDVLQKMSVELKALAESDDPADRDKALIMAEDMKHVNILGEHIYSSKKSDNSFKYAGYIDKMEEEILQARSKTEKALKKKQKKQQEAYIKGVYGRITEASLSDDPIERYKLGARLNDELEANKDNIDFSKYKILKDGIEKIMDDKGFAETSNRELYDKFRLAVSTGELSRDELMANSHYLNREDFSSLMGLIDKYEDLDKRDTAKAREYHDFVTAGSKILGANGTEVPALEAVSSEKRVQHFRLAMADLKAEYIKEHNAYPDRATMRKWMNDVMEEADKLYPRVVKVENTSSTLDTTNVAQQGHTGRGATGKPSASPVNHKANKKAAIDDYLKRLEEMKKQKQ